MCPITAVHKNPIRKLQNDWVLTESRRSSELVVPAYSPMATMHTTNEAGPSST